MPEHVHEWKFFNSDIPFLCLKTDCLESMGWAEAARRLNATERLSAATASHSAHSLSAFHGCALCERRGDELLAYAAALEGEDDLSTLATQQKLNQEDMEGA